MNGDLDYRQAGVDIAAGEAAVERIKSLARSTTRPEVLQGLGGFGGLFAPNLKGIQEPVLVAGTDGVGTKLRLAFACGRHDTVGIDCVAMCVNDILVQGAEPLFFLDYLAVGKMDPDQVAAIVSGVAEGCRQAGCALLGGETAEMPGFYPPGEYDLAGFAVGLVDRTRLVDGSGIAAGDALVGLASSGLHSNGFSLARRVLLEEAQLALSDFQPAFGDTLGAEMLKPTRIYVRPVLAALERFKVRGMAHITGGGLPGNLPRMLPPGLRAVLDGGAWPLPPVFTLIGELGPVQPGELYRVFNMGIGFVLAVPRAEGQALVDHFTASGVEAYLIGTVEAGSGGLVWQEPPEGG